MGDTLVSDDNMQMIENQMELMNLLDDVPAGIGIYEIRDGIISQTYMNDAFYTMLGTNRESRRKYFGENVLNSTHPDDIVKIRDGIEKVMHGANLAETTYRIKSDNGKWFWVHFIAKVIERRDNYVKLYTAFTDYNEIKAAQTELENGRITLTTALQSVGVLTWRYDYKRKCIVDTLSFGTQYALPKTIDNVPESIIQTGLVAEQSIDDFRKLYEEVVSETIVTKEIMTNERNSKGHLWYRLIYTPVFDNAGNYIETIGSAIDISEQKNKEQHYEEQLRLNSIAAQDALSKIILNLSNNTITKFEYSDERFVGLNRMRTVDDILGSVKLAIKDEEQRKKFQRVADSKAMLNAYREGENHIEIVCKLDDNTKWMKVTYDIVENPYTRDIEVISTIHDITEMIRNELVVNRLMSIDYESIMIIDTFTGDAHPFEQVKGEANTNEIMILQEKFGSGQMGLDTFLREYAVEGTAEQAIEDNKLDKIRYELTKAPYYECMYSLNREGKIQHYRIIYAYLEGNDGVLLCAVQNVTDMYDNEEKQKYELAVALKEAENANSAKTDFLSRVSHDMRTPLNGILGTTTLLKNYVTDTKVLYDLNQLEQSGKYLLNLINDTLDVNKIESGKVELHPTVCNSEIFFKNALDLIRPNIKEKNIEFKVNVENVSFAMLYIDTGRVQQIGMSILENKRVLLCEDHPINKAIAIRLLKNKGVNVEYAENGQIGVDMFKASDNNYYDAILMDIRMPILNGIDAAKAIRALERADAKQIPIIAMTANALSSDVEATQAAGMNAHLSKPIDAEILYRTMCGLMKKTNV